MNTDGSWQLLTYLIKPLTSLNSPKNITLPLPAMCESSSMMDLCPSFAWRLCLLTLMKRVFCLPERFGSVAIFTLWAIHCQVNPSGFGFPWQCSHTADHWWLGCACLSCPCTSKSTTLAKSGEFTLLCCTAIGFIRLLMFFTESQNQHWKDH